MRIRETRHGGCLSLSPLVTEWIYLHYGLTKSASSSMAGWGVKVECSLTTASRPQINARILEAPTCFMQRWTAMVIAHRQCIRSRSNRHRHPCSVPNHRIHHHRILHLDYPVAQSNHQQCGLLAHGYSTLGLRRCCRQHSHRTIHRQIGRRRHLMGITRGWLELIVCLDLIYKNCIPAGLWWIEYAEGCANPGDCA